MYFQGYKRNNVIINIYSVKIFLTLPVFDQQRIWFYYLQVACEFINNPEPYESAGKG